MFSFLVGLATGLTVLLNGPSVRRGVARAALTGGDAAATLAREAIKLSSRTREDFEDAFAEARQHRAEMKAQQDSVSNMISELRRLRQELGTVGSNPTIKLQ